MKIIELTHDPHFITTTLNGVRQETKLGRKEELEEMEGDVVQKTDVGLHVVLIHFNRAQI